jgi:farnesyl-diphosphate farnesyltransferase
MIEFGLALQLVNIYKDMQTDKERGWTYIPASILQQHRLQPEDFLTDCKTEQKQLAMKELSDLLSPLLEKSLIYTLALPRRLVRPRLFCAIPLLLAVRTLAALQRRTVNPSLPGKLSRTQVYRTLGRCLFCIFSNRLLRQTFRTLSDTRTG